MEWFASNGFTVLAPDVIGIGETGGNLSRSNYVWYASILIGRSLTGIRSGDVNRLAGLLQKHTGISEIYGLARKEMSPVLLHAAAFNPSIKRIALIKPYCSYRSIVMNRFYETGFVHGTVAGSLQAYDLPDLAASLAPRKLVIAGVTDGSGNTDNKEDIFEDMSVIQDGYKYGNAVGNLKIVSGDSSGKLQSILLEWMK